MLGEFAYPRLDTPSVVVELEVLEANIARAAAAAGRAGVRLRRPRPLRAGRRRRDDPHGDAAAVPVRKHLIEVAAMCNLVAEIFDGDIEKAKAWFKAVNPLLGDVAPRDMVRLGRVERLRIFIGSSLQGR